MQRSKDMQTRIEKIEQELFWHDVDSEIYSTSTSTFIESLKRERDELMLKISQVQEVERFLDLYGDIVHLRNRLSNDGSGQIYDEDHILLDSVLDFMDTLLTKTEN